MYARISTTTLFVCLIGVLALSASDAESAGTEGWESILSKARQEGKVNLASNLGMPAFRQELTSAFSKRFGISMDYRAVAGGELVAIAERECAAGRPTMDLLLGGNSEVLTLYPKGCLAPLKPVLVLPEVTSPSLWLDGTLKWTDPEGQYLLRTAEPIYGSVIFFKSKIRPSDIASAMDLLKPELRGKIASYDPRVGGPGQSMAAYLLDVFGEEYVHKLYVGQKVVYTNNHRQLAEWIARGTYWIGLGPVDHALEPLLQQDLPIGVADFSDAPGYISGFSVVKRIKNSANPNAGIVLANWLASKEGQEIYQKATFEPSRRTDVDKSKIPLWRIPQEGRKYLDNYEHAYYTVRRPQVAKLLLQILGR